jgi:hypothetical protein
METKSQEIMTLKEASNYTRMAPAIVRQMAETGQIRTTYIKKRRYFFKADLDEINKKNKFYKDHCGNIYVSRAAMCEYYGLTVCAYTQRIMNGWTLEKALTTPLHKNGKNEISRVTDHHGNTYKNIAEMAKQYNINTDILTERLRRGWDTQKALKTPAARNRKEMTDSKGRTYPSLDEYAEAIGLTRDIIYRLQKKGYTPKEIEGYVRKDTTCTDHKGNKYHSFRAMCHAYGIPHNTVRARLRYGYTLKEALTLKKHEKSRSVK